MKLFLNTLLLFVLIVAACNNQSAPQPEPAIIVPDTIPDSCQVVEIIDSADSECDTITFDTLGKDVMLIGD